MMSQIYPQQHKQTTNITTMVMDLIASPAVWILWIHAARVVGGLAHTLFKAAVKVV